MRWHRLDKEMMKLNATKVKPTRKQNTYKNLKRTTTVPVEQSARPTQSIEHCGEINLLQKSFPIRTHLLTSPQSNAIHSFKKLTTSGPALCSTAITRFYFLQASPRGVERFLGVQQSHGREGDGDFDLDVRGRRGRCGPAPLLPSVRLICGRKGLF